MCGLVPSSPAKKNPSSLVYITMTWGWCEAGGGTGSNSTATKQKIILKKNVDVYNRNQLFFFPFPISFIYFFEKGGLLSLFPPPLGC